jgi:hypothetical protein
LLDELQVILSENDNGSLNRLVGGQNNIYSWFKNGVAVVLDNRVVNSNSGLLNFNPARFEDEGTYTATVTNGSVPGLTITTTNLEVLVSSLARDRATLLSIFAKNGGASWANPNDGAITGWNANTPIANWSFVTLSTDGLRVESVDLSNVGLTGDLEKQVLAMTSLRSLNLSGNNLTRLPDFKSMPNLVSLNVSDNKLQFDDLQKNLGIQTYTYSPQKPLFARNTIKIPAGTDVPISIPVRGENLTYTWYYGSDIIPNATGSTYTIPAIGFNNMGEYSLEVSDLLVGKGFKLIIEPQEYLATAYISGNLFDKDGKVVKDGIVFLYDPKLLGQAWQEINNLISVDGTYSFTDVVLGDYAVLTIGDIEKYLPSYHESSFTWADAKVFELRRDLVGVDITYTNQVTNPELGDNSVFGVVGLDDDNFPAGFFGGRTLGRRTVANAGVAFSRLRATNRGEEVFDLVAYVLTDAEGKFSAENLKDGTYKINIEYPGVPMDPNSFLIFDLGSNGAIDQNAINLDAEVFPGGIVVQKVKETGIYRDYFKNLNIFPNPAVDYINISYERLNSENVKMEIIDLTGSKILESKLPSGFNQNIELDVTNLKAGMYIINFIDTVKGVRSITSSKLIINR